MRTGIEERSLSTSLQELDRQIAQLWQMSNPIFQKRGQREYPFGTVYVGRTRLWNKADQRWCVPAARVCSTPQRKCILDVTRKVVVDQFRKVSLRTSQKLRRSNPLMICIPTRSTSCNPEATTELVFCIRFRARFQFSPTSTFGLKAH